MDSGAIILINLGADRGGLIGAFVVWDLLQAAFSRTDVPEHERRPFHLFADEFQTYMTTAFPMLQAQARKYGVDTVIAHQVRAQLTPEIAEITPAVGNLIIFRVTSHNADSLSREFDTTPPTPPPPTLARRQAHLVLSPSPWTDLLQKGHTNREVVTVLDRIKKLFYHRNAKDFTQRVGLEASGFTVQVTYAERDWNSSTPMPFVTLSSADPSRWTVPFREPHYHPYLDYSANPLPIDALAEWANPNFYAREQGRDEAQLLEDMLDKFCSLHPKVDLATYETQMSGHLRWNDRVLRSQEAAMEVVEWKLRHAVREALRKELKGLAVLLVQEPMMTESGQFKEEVIPERPMKTSDEMAREIANEFVHLENYHARCKITREKARPTEHLISTFDYPGIENEELTRRLRGKSSDRFGRDRREVERAIEERLRIRRETNADEGEPILREKAATRTQTRGKQK